MHHELCDGLDLRQCHGCRRHVDRYSQTVQDATKTRLRPMASGGRCADWLELQAPAVNSTHDKL